jgi:hypothetical protein
MGSGNAPDPDERYCDDDFTYGAKGNKKTCRAQGFYPAWIYEHLLQSESLFLLFDGGLLRYEGVPNQEAPAHILDFVLACGGIPFYENACSGCYVAPPPLPDRGQGYHDILIFAVVPICTAVDLYD